MMKRTSFWVLVLEGVIGFHRKSQFQLLQHQWLEHRLGLLWFEWFALEMNWDPSVIFEIAPKYCISDSFVDYKDYSISSTGFFFFFPYGILVHNSRSNHHLNWMKTLSLLKTVLFSLSRFHVCFFVSTYHIFYFSVMFCLLPGEWNFLEGRDVLVLITAISIVSIAVPGI